MTEIVYRRMRTEEAPAVCALVRRVFDACIFAEPDAMQERLRSGGFVHGA